MTKKLLLLALLSLNLMAACQSKDEATDPLLGTQVDGDYETSQSSPMQ